MNAAALQTARILWLAMLVAVGGYLVALLVVVGSGGAPVVDTAVLRLVFLGLAGVQVVAIVVLRRRWPAADARGDASLSPYVVCWALAEAIALYGLVLGLLAHELTTARPFFVAAVALLLWLRPRGAPGAA